MIIFPTRMAIPPVSYLDVLNPPKESDKYEVLVLHRESDNVCVIRLAGFENDVFWKEIKLNRPFAWSRIQRAKDKAIRKARQLQDRDMDALHTFEGSK